MEMAGDITEVAVVVGMQEDVTAKMPAVKGSLESIRPAVTQLAQGVMYMGSMFMGLAVAMERSNNETLRGVGQTVALAGGLLTAVGSAAQFVRAAANISRALSAINLQLIIQKALSGPAGWATLAIGAAVAGGTIAAVSSMDRSQKAASVNNSVTINNQGSVVTSGRLVDDVKRGLVLNQRQNYTTGLR